MPDAPRLRIDGREYPDWEDVQVTMDLEQVPDTFSLTSTTPRRDLAAGAVCEILIRDSVILTGRLEKPRWHNGKDGRSFSVAGRSLPGDLVDCAAEPGTYNGLDLATLAEQLAEPYGVKVRCQFIAPIVPTLRIKPGESVYRVIEKQARMQALIWRCAPDGALVLDRPGQKRSTTLLAFPAVESIDTSLDMTQRFDRVECRGQVAGDDSTWGLDAHASASLSDPSLKGKRRLILNAPNTATAQMCADRAAVEVAARYGKSAQVTVERSTWLQDDGTPWETGMLVPAKDEWTGLDTRMVLRSVSLGYSAQNGTTCTLGLVLPQAYVWDRVQASSPVVAKGLRQFWPELRGNW